MQALASHQASLTFSPPEHTMRQPLNKHPDLAQVDQSRPVRPYHVPGGTFQIQIKLNQFNSPFSGSEKGFTFSQVVIYGFKLLIPTLVIPGQTDDMIVGSNAIKQLIHLMKKSEDYWRLLAAPVDIADDDCSQFLSLLSNSEECCT